MSPDDDRDYITINPAVAAEKYNVVVMHWNPQLQEYMVFRASRQLSEAAARALAHSWAAACHLEIR